LDNEGDGSLLEIEKVGSCSPFLYGFEKLTPFG